MMMIFERNIFSHLLLVGRVKERYFAPAPYGISYSYNIRGWLTASSWGKYRQTIAYGNFSPDITFIQEDRYRADGSRYQYQRHFYYDGLGRLDHTWDYESGRYTEQYGYDLNGNITSLRRGGPDAYDVLTMGYDGNRLTSVTDSGNDNLLGEVPQLAAGGAYAMDYDADGRLTADESRGVTRVVYNPLGLPQRVTMDDGCYVTNAYRADGVKTYESTLRQHYEYIRQWDAAQGGYVVVDSVPRSQTDWRSHYGALVKAKGRLPRIYNEAGYIDIHNGGDSVSYHYWLTDHLGSVHAVVDANNQMEQAHDYTVSGVPATRLGQTVDHHLHTGMPWLGFNGLGWYDNRARVLDALTGRFTTPDPLAERYPDQSPYAHCANNPVSNIDPTGKETILYATTIPGNNNGFLKPATHTFIVVKWQNGEIRDYFAYGPKNDHIFGDMLVQKTYIQDVNVAVGKDKTSIKSSFIIQPPNGMTSEDFDNKIIDVAKSFGNNENIKYSIIPTKETEGNCNTSTSTILLKAGVPKETIRGIEKLLPGINTGFNSEVHPWNSFEQKKAVEQEMRINSIKQILKGTLNAQKP